MMERILQYRSSDGKFVTSRTEIVTTTGTLTLNAGYFLINGNGNTDKKEVRVLGAPSTLKLGELAFYTYGTGTQGNLGDRIFIGEGGVDGNRTQTM